MSDDTRNRLLERAKKYDFDQLQIFIDETGWEDWMETYVDTLEGEYLTEKDSELIDYILTEIFNEAQAELQKERENFKEMKLVKEGNGWALYIGELHCGWGRFEDMVESISELETYEDFKEYARECQECR